MRKKGRRDETVSQRFVAGVPAAEAAPRCSRRRPGTRFDSCEAPRGAGKLGRAAKTSQVRDQRPGRGSRVQLVIFKMLFPVIQYPLM